MSTPEWLKPALYGAAAGAVALAIVGFSWAGWVTAGTAKKMASEEAQQQVIAALVPICVEQSKQDPQASEKMADLKSASSWKRRDLLIKTGWATMPGATKPDRDLASACMKKLTG